VYGYREILPHKIKKEGKKEGRKEGREEGRKGGREEGRKGGREEGREIKLWAQRVMYISFHLTHIETFVNHQYPQDGVEANRET
jgi:predicted transposase YdaD